MKKLFRRFTLGLFLFSLMNLSCAFGEESSSLDKSINWISYKQAMKDAQISGKYPVLFFTGSNWCIWCLRMEEEILSCPVFIEYAEKNFLMVKVDFPMGVELSPMQSKENEELKQRYGVTGFPTFLVLNNTGKVLLEDGYMPGGGKEYMMRLQRQLDQMNKK